MAFAPWRSKKPSTRATSHPVLQERAPEPAAELQARRVAGERARRGQRDQEAERGVAALGRQPGDEQDQLAVDDEAEEDAGLDEDQRRDRRVDPLAERLGGSGERAGQVGDGDRSRRDDERSDARKKLSARASHDREDRSRPGRSAMV